MNCEECRARLGAEPGARPEDVAAHLAGCPDCAALAAEAEAFEARLKRALQVPVPARAPPDVGRVLALERRGGSHTRRWLALAAGLAAVALLVPVLLTFYPRTSLASALVDHMGHEPDAWAVTPVPVARGALDYVLGRSGVRLDPTASSISYAQSCFFRGRHVPHLVVQTPSGPMTVMVLRHEHVAAPESFDEGGYRGLILPAGAGAVAVIARAPVAAARVAEVAAQVTRAVSFTDAG